MDKVELGKALREARTGKSLTQEQLAELADIGVMYLGEIERGKKMPSLKVFIKLIEALGVSADYILRNELSIGKDYVFDEITQMLAGLSPKQRKCIAEMIAVYVANQK